MSSVFDNLDALRVTQNDPLQVERLILNVPVRKPPRDEFIRVHPSLDYRLQTTLAKDPDTGEQFLVLPKARGALADLGDFKTVDLRLYVNRRADPAFWPLPVQNPNTNPNHWTETARQGAVAAETRWVRIVPDMASRCYKLLAATGDLDDPQWPTDSLNTLLEKAFRDRLIESDDHPLVRRLLGEL
jgi:hypothetical protein